MKVPLPVSMLAVTFTIIYVSMCPVLNPWLVDGMMFHPETELSSTRLNSINNVGGREITFEHGLTGWIFQIPKSKYVVLFSHGNAGTLADRVDKVARLLSCGQSVFIWDYPGFGHSSGSASLKNIPGEAVAAYDYLMGLGYTPQQIILYGESLGSGINADIIDRRKVKGVIVDSGFTSLIAVAKERCPIFYLYPDFLLPPPSMRVRETLGNLPSLIIHSTNDEVIPYHNASELHPADPNSTLISLPGSRHNNVTPQDSTKLDAALKEFFKSL